MLYIIQDSGSQLWSSLEGLLNVQMTKVWRGHGEYAFLKSSVELLLVRDYISKTLI